MGRTVQLIVYQKCPQQDFPEKQVKLTIYGNVETTANLSSTVTRSRPRDSVFADGERIIFIVVARRHSHGLHVGSWELPLVSKHHCGLVWLKVFYSVDWTRDPWIRVNCKGNMNYEKSICNTGIDLHANLQDW